MPGKKGKAKSDGRPNSSQRVVQSRQEKRENEEASFKEHLPRMASLSLPHFLTSSHIPTLTHTQAQAQTQAQAPVTTSTQPFDPILPQLVSTMAQGNIYIPRLSLPLISPLLSFYQSFSYRVSFSSYSSYSSSSASRYLILLSHSLSLSLSLLHSLSRYPLLPANSHRSTRRLRHAS